MKGNGNSIGTLSQKLWFFLIPSSGARTKYIRKHAHLFRHVGEKLFWQPRKFPTDPEHISIGNNVKVSASVSFINHDVTGVMLNHKYNTREFQRLRGCIEIGDNVMIGAGVRILANVRVGSNVVIGAGSVVTKDIPDNSVAAGIPCKVVGSFEDFVEKRRNVKDVDTEQLWEDFYKQRENSGDQE